MDIYLENLETELDEATKKLALISDTVDKIELNKDDAKIKYGSRVLITWVDGRTNEGRVLYEKGNGVFGVNRDGYSGTINLGVNREGLTEHSLRNLSVGTYGTLERDKWILTQKVSDLQKKIDQTIEIRINGIKEELLTRQMSRNDINKVISSSEFQIWYKKEINSDIFPTLDKWPDKLLSAIAKDFISQSKSRDIYNFVLRGRI